MPNPYIDSLASLAGGHVGLVTDTAALADWLVHAIVRDVGIAISTPAIPITAFDFHSVNSYLLDKLKYADRAAYAAAVAAGDFIHPEDLPVATDHVLHKSSAIYDLRLKRGDNGQYRKCRVQSMTFARTNSGPLRVAIVEAL